MNHKERAELEKQAQAKLAEARRLINEAGALAKQGQFVLEFGEIGTFIPKRYADPELYRDEITEHLKAEGLKKWNSTTQTYDVMLWDKMDVDERKKAIDDQIERTIESLEIPWEFREYDGEGTDSWWHPSRC